MLYHLVGNELDDDNCCTNARCHYSKASHSQLVGLKSRSDHAGENSAALELYPLQWRIQPGQCSTPDLYYQVNLDDERLRLPQSSA